MHRAVLPLLSLVLALGCARRAAPVAERTMAPQQTVAFLRSQLAGHLDRARGCFDDAARRHPGDGGMVRYSFDILPNGRVSAPEVEAFAQDDAALAACVRARLVSLYFDPAPPEPVHIERVFVDCEGDADGVCRLGPARAVGDLDPGVLVRVNESLADRDRDLRACAEGATSEEAVFDVRLALGPDGRIMEGRVERAFPDNSALRRCAVGPLLGTRIEGEGPSEEVELRYVYRLGGASTDQARN